MTQPCLPPLYPFIFLFYGYLEVLLFHVSVLLSGAAALWCRPCPLPRGHPFFLPLPLLANYLHGYIC